MKTRTKLYGVAEFVLFITSYLPLFILIVFKQFSENTQYLYWGGLKFENLLVFITKFGFSTLLLITSFISLIGCKLLFSNFEKNINNGENVTLVDVKNRNSESIGYIATYIIPFIFQSFNSWYEIFAFFFLMFIIYRIYINSNLLLINPILSFNYSIFEIEYEEQNGKKRNGLIIIKDKHIEEESMITIYSIGQKLFYAKKS
ncbi:MAG: hypothetical protein REI96_22110 [Flavobacterium nitrogenifigens]|uniref:hypothetical protein n=1 Tax=Flavobacterium nitrogenifigens TaxID=1617283 RepID=UPI00280A01DE|nr:hypothetical protein [Flavobacterium nitrogenifigens]MDQ8015157.1 hypothetical protein [Flavobacterium nitrogenifigens]